MIGSAVELLREDGRQSWSLCDVAKRMRQKNPSRNPSRSSQIDGFALIDVLVGLALVGVISSLMIVFLGQARTIMRIESATEMQMEVDAAARFMETMLSGAEPLPLSQSSPDNVIYLSGDAAKIQFSSVQAIGFRSSSLREIAISLADHNQEKTLLIVRKPRRGNAVEETSESESVPVITGVANIKFEYLDRSTEARDWLPEWKSSRSLPSAVRFTISVDRDGMVYSASGLVRLSLAATAVSPTT